MPSYFVAPFDVLDTRELGDDIHQLLEPLVFHSEVLAAHRRTLPPGLVGWDAMFTVPAGHLTDFMSIPRALPIAHSLLAGRARRAGVIHDALYQLHLVPRRVADAVLPEVMAVCLQSEWRCWLAWSGVRIGGRAAYRTGPSRRQVLTGQPFYDPMGEA